MKVNLLCATVIFIFSQIVLAAPQKLKYYVNGKYSIVEVAKVNSVKVNAFCIKNPSCEALKIVNGKPFKVRENNIALAGNPGANYCWDVGAKNRILKDAKGNEYDFCVFTDGSMADAWNLFAKHYPAKRGN